MSKKIGLIGLTSNKNIGDYLLAESTKFLIKKHSADTSFIDIDVDPRDEGVYKGRRKINLRLFEVLSRYDKSFHNIVRIPLFQYYYQRLYWHIKLNWYYKKLIKDLDGLVFVGGGFIKFKNQGLNYLDEQIIKIAEKRNIPVMFNASGIEGYDEKDIRCQRLKKVINSSIVKVITTRDDLDTLRSKYITNKDIVTDLVGDPVFWLKDMYSLNNSKKQEKTGRIGVNLVNPNNFARYGGAVNKRAIENFYKNLLQELTMNDADFYLYTNGMEIDHDFGKRLIRSMNIPAKRLLRAPEVSPELVDTTLQFDIILSARMHAGIVAYALDIPVVGLIWSKKIDHFARIAKIRDRYFDETELDYRRIAQLLLSNSLEEPDGDKREELKSKTLHYLSLFYDTLETKGNK